MCHIKFIRVKTVSGKLDRHDDDCMYFVNMAYMNYIICPTLFMSKKFQSSTLQNAGYIPSYK